MKPTGLHNISLRCCSILAAVAIAAAALVSCSDDSVRMPVDADNQGYLEMVIYLHGSDASSRADDLENKNEEESDIGLDYERKIRDLNIFIYSDKGKGLNGNYPLIWSRFLPKDSIEVKAPQISSAEKIYEIKVQLKDDEMRTLSAPDMGYLRAIVIANAGEDFLTTIKLKNIEDTGSLSSFCNYGNAWQDDEGLRLIMSNASATDGILIRAASPEKKEVAFYGEIILSRIVARIDLLINGDNIEENEQGKKYLQYTVAETDHRLILTNAIPVNLMQNNSFLLKHVSVGLDTEQVVYAGEETLSGLKPSNYVVTPDFDEKPTDDKKCLEWFGSTAASVLKAKGDSELYSLSKLDNQMISSAHEFGNALEYGIILTYANENTHDMKIQSTGTSSHPSDYLTGLLLRAQYIPDKVYTSYTSMEVYTKEDYKKGDDFWLFRKLADDEREKDNLYFANVAALNNYIETLPEGCNFETKKYTGGICYYNIWIRHNTKSEDNYPMKYGIVRNTIYRVSFKFLGIGHPTPEISEPYNIVSRIFVAKWNFMSQPEIIM